MSTDAMQRAWRAASEPGARERRPDAEAWSLGRVGSSRREPLRAAPDYSLWSVEELRAFAAQMQVPGAAAKSRRELLEIFVPSPPRSSSAA